MKLYNIVVTGITSFIGTHISLALNKKGHRVIGTISNHRRDYDPLRQSRINLLEKMGVDICGMDLTKEESCKELIRNNQPNVWIHHAGWATNYAGDNYNLTQGNEVNVVPLEDIYRTLSACRCNGVIITGSSMEYSYTSKPCKEDDSCWPDTPYGLSKLAETIRSRQLSIQYNLPTRVARVFIPYGSFDSPNKLIPSTIDALRSGRDINLSPCEQKRDFLYVEDIVFGYLKLVEDLSRDTLFDIFNLCSGEATQLKTLLYAIADLLRADPALLCFGAISMRPGEPEISYGSNQKAKNLLGWKPRPLQKGLNSYLNTLMENVPK